MQFHKLSFAETGQFSSLITDYVAGQAALQKFYKYPLSLEAFDRVIDEKSMQPLDREALVEVLRAQYRDVATDNAVEANIEALLDSNTFTITTAHQPVIGTGPLYMIIKILAAINLSEKLNARYPDVKFVPVYWSGGEDHDFEEINHLHVFGKKISWEAPSGGPVGRISTDTMQDWVTELRALLGDHPNAASWMDLIESAYLQQPTLAQATFYLMHQLFQSYGLVILQPDNATLKKAFLPIMEAELFHPKSPALVAEKVAGLEQLGYHGQAHAREINLFYLMDEMRARIQYNENKDRYEVVDTDIKFSEDTLRAELLSHPERFSPNVILRPLYQEAILPNLAYVGGGGELAYWMQYESLFEHYKINYPMLVLRNSVMWLDKGAHKKRLQTELTLHDLFRDVEELIKEYVKEHAKDELSLAPQKRALQALFAEVVEMANAIDPTLEKPVKGEEQKTINSLEKLEAKLLRAEKSKFDTAVNQIRWIKDKLFPAGKLQERHDNIAMYWHKHGPACISILKEAIHPIEEQFVIIEED